MSNNTTPTKNITPVFPDIRDKSSTSLLDNKPEAELLTLEKNSIYIDKSKDNLPVTQSNHRKCWNCNKKVGYTGFKCKCGYTFCGAHRYYNTHNCTYDHKGQDIAKLRSLNPQVIADKVNKI